mmetsp:Transcript_14049/g.48387  ORF Transcript_14049/g.48387 Transcript_14049/m.48387 type:complete len:488 (-) Transcript_14049:131-1594(-)
MPKRPLSGSAAGMAHGHEYDIVVVGGGSGGVRCARTAAAQGKKVACVELPFSEVSGEGAGGLGGTCVIRGCVPKKLLMYGSALGADLEDAAGFGWEVGRPGHRWAPLLEAKRKEITRLNGVYGRLLAGAGVEHIEGRGELVGPGAVQVRDAATGAPTRLLTAESIVVATGGRAVKPDIPGAELGITSDEALSLDTFPRRLVVVGSGYIGLEFAQIYRGLGSDVTLVYRQDLPLRGFDEDVRGVVSENLKLRGVNVVSGRSPKSVEKAPGGRLVLKTDKGDSLEADVVMFATGRVPNTARPALGLDKVGVKLDGRGAVVVDEYSRTSVPGIYAIGDVTNRINLTPVALAEGMALSKTLCGVPTRPDHEDVPSAVFTQPPVATCGLTEAQAQQRYNQCDVYVATFRPMRHTVSGREEKALMKLVVDAETDRVVGVHVVAPDSAEMIQGFGVAMKCNATKAQFDATIGVHPSGAEELVTMRQVTRRVSKL